MKELDLQDKCNTLGRHNYNLACLAQDGSDTVYRTIVNNKNKLIELQNVILHMPLPTNLTRCQTHMISQATRELARRTLTVKVNTVYANIVKYDK